MMMRKNHFGMTLIELMVALAIGAFLMIGAITVFMQSRTTFRINESLSRLQENARFALDILEPDIRMAHYWGLTSRSYLIQGRAAPTDPPGLGPDDCGNNWTIDLNRAVEGTNNGYEWDCAEFDTAMPDSDTLVVRRASEDTVAPAAGQLSIQSARSQLGLIFDAGAVPAGYDPTTSATHRLIVNGYYVDQSSLVDGVPSLRRQVLRATGVIEDEELIAGVEDMQIQFGIDTDPPGTPSVPNLERGSVDRFVEPDDPIIDPTDAAFDPNVEILAVRLWLRVRAERPEQGFTDTVNYVYADQDVGPFNDGFRRLLVSKTIYLRNARPSS